MRIGIDARLGFYADAGISQYTLRLVQGLAEIDQQDEFLVLRDRRDSLAITDNSHFRRINLWTPSHHRLEQWGLRFELPSLGLDLLHSPSLPISPLLPSPTIITIMIVEQEPSWLSL